MRELSRQLIPCLDLTLLDETATSADVMVLCQQAQTAYGDVAAVCIYPQWLEQAKQATAGTSIALATVVNFPMPTLSIDQIAHDIEQALAQGADEIDVVMPYDLLQQGGSARVEKILARCRQATGSNVLKVIIESGALQSNELIAQATQLVVDCGAEFVKTSTGKVPVGATMAAVEAMLAVLKNSHGHTGIKLSGGIRNVVTAYEYVQLVKRYMGDDWCDARNFRIGASQLLQDIIRQIEQPVT